VAQGTAPPTQPPLPPVGPCFPRLGLVMPGCPTLSRDLSKQSVASVALMVAPPLGDTIQFSRYASLVAKSGTQVLLEVQKPLVGILKGLEGVSQAFAQGEPLPAFDYHCPLLSLPLALRTTLKTIPADIPYIKAGQRELEVWSNRLGRKTKPRIGLAWSGSPTYKKDHNRNIEVASLLPHLPNGCEYFALQKDVREHDKAALSQSVVRYFGEELKDGNCRDWPVRSSTPRPARFWSRTGRWTRRPQRGLK